jgi:hypothetical protein
MGEPEFYGDPRCAWGQRPTIEVSQHERIPRALARGLMCPVRPACRSIARENGGQTDEMSRDQHKPQVSHDDLH